MPASASPASSFARQHPPAVMESPRGMMFQVPVCGGSPPEPPVPPVPAVPPLAPPVPALPPLVPPEPDAPPPPVPPPLVPPVPALEPAEPDVPALPPTPVALLLASSLLPHATKPRANRLATQNHLPRGRPRLGCF